MIKEKKNYKDIHEQIKYIKETFKKEKISVHKQSFLFKLLDKVLRNYKKLNTAHETFDALYVYRIYSALLMLKEVEKKNGYLKDLLNGTFDFMDRKQSHAKNILFELEVGRQFKKIFEHTYLSEPDIVVSIDTDSIGIACKKINSEKNLEKQLSKASKQIKKNNDFNYGIIAINIDNSLPKKTILQSKTKEEASTILFRTINLFFQKKENNFYLKKYLSEDKIIGILIVASTIVDLKNEKPRFNNIYESNLFTSKNIKYKNILFKLSKLENH